AAVVPEDGRAEHGAAFVEEDEAVHLPRQPHGGDLGGGLGGVEARRVQHGADAAHGAVPPQRGVLLAPERARRRVGVLGGGAGDDRAGGVEEERLGGGRRDVEAENVGHGGVLVSGEECRDIGRNAHQRRRMPRPVIRAAVLLMALPLFKAAAAQTIALGEEDATVWAQEQVAAGTITGTNAGTLYVNGEPIPFTAEGGVFAVPLRLTEPETEVVACVASGGGEGCPDTLRWALGYVPRPEAEVRASVAARTVTFEGRVLANPGGPALSFAWAEDPGNPAALGLVVQNDSTAVAVVPEGAPPGEYYVDWTVSAADGDGRRARTFVTVEAGGGIRPFVLETDHAAWVDRATVYEIAPRYFANQYLGRFEPTTQQLPEIAALGVTAAWLHPIHPTANGA